MPIKLRGDINIYTRITRMIRNATNFIIFGTYSINTDYSIVRMIIDRKRNFPNLFVCAFIPPPTDFIIWDFSIRREFIKAYGLPSNAQEELNEAIVVNPIPAFQVLEQKWQQSQTRRPTARYSHVLRHIRQIFYLWSKNIHILLEPNTHAKFILTENEIYEGSANLTRYGIEVNVEVYNFYPMGYPNIYRYAFRTYTAFLIDYMSRFVMWKDASNYINNANLLGQTVSDIISNLQIKFNPSISTKKINKIRTARVYLNELRSKIWMLPGIKEIFKNDMILCLIDRNLSNIIGRLYDILNVEEKSDYIKKTTREILGEINKQLMLNIKGLKQFEEHFPWKHAKIDEIEMMKNEWSVKEFKLFIEKLKNEGGTL